MRKIPTERAMHLLLFACLFNGLQRFATVADTPQFSFRCFSQQTLLLLLFFGICIFGFLVGFETDGMACTVVYSGILKEKSFFARHTNVASGCCV
jgi:hypothetical protein